MVTGQAGPGPASPEAVCSYRVVNKKGATPPCGSNVPVCRPGKVEGRKKMEEHRCHAVVKSRKIRRRSRRDPQIQSPPLSLLGARCGLPLAWARGGGLRAAELADLSGGELKPTPRGLGSFVALVGL